MGLGQRVKQLIDNKGLTAYELSVITGISQGSLSRIINSNTKKLAIRNIEVLANYFKVSPDWLRTGAGESPIREVDTGPRSVSVSGYYPGAA